MMWVSESLIILKIEGGAVLAQSRGWVGKQVGGWFGRVGAP